MSEIQSRLAYFYAKIKISTRKCMGVFTTSEPETNGTLYEYVEIEGLNEDYMGKYYINGAWYEDAAGTIPWSPTN